MGGSVSVSLSCLCTDPTYDINEVPVMKVDGKLISFKEGTTVRSVLAENPSHKLVLCNRERTVLPDSFHLSCNHFYFLLPQGLELNDDNFGQLLRLVLRKERKYHENSLGKKLESEIGCKSGSYGQDLQSDSKKWNNRWKPDLDTIPEGKSPAVNSG